MSASVRLAIFDTNVIVSAGIRQGTPPARLVMDWVLEGQIQLVTCPTIVAEYRQVLGRPKFSRHLFPPTWLDVLIQDSLLLDEPSIWPFPLPDPDDAAFLALAKMSGAVLVTGNMVHFPDDQRDGVAVLTPAEFLRRLNPVA